VPGQVTELYSYDHDLAAFVAIGTGTVTADGLLIRSDPGVGILKAGWHCGGNPNSTGQAASLMVGLAPVALQYGSNARAAATGSPPLDGVYANWTVKNKNFDANVTFRSQPACPNQPSCSSILDAPEIPRPHTARQSVCGMADIEVTFRCTTTGHSVKATARLDLGCGGSGPAACVAICSDQSTQGMCGTPCTLIGHAPGAFNGNSDTCWKVPVSGIEYCYWDARAPTGTDFVNLCCPNRCHGQSFNVWGQPSVGGPYMCTVVERCDANPEFAKAFGGFGCIPVTP
jgi:hypothetical protein